MTENNQSFVHPRQLNRRSGRTTRAIDEMVQHLFNHGVVELWDHADSFDNKGRRNNLAFKSMERIFFNRLYQEHLLKIGMGLTYDEKNNIVRLKKSENEY